MRKFRYAFVLWSSLFVGCHSENPKAFNEPTAIHHWQTSDRNSNRDNRDLLPVKVGGKWGYINRAGSITIPPQYDKAENFVYDLAEVCMGDCYVLGNRGKHGLVGTDGRFVINPVYGMIGVSDGELIAVCTGACNYTGENSKWGYVDRRGSIVIEPQFGEVGEFSEGIAPVCVGTNCSISNGPNGKWGFIDKAGKFVVNPQYDGADSMIGGRAQISFGHPNYTADRKEGEVDEFKVGYIDSAGKVIYPPTN